MGDGDILQSVRASLFRRAVAAAVIAAVGLLLINAGLAGEAGMIGSAFFLAAGALAIWASFASWAATNRTLVLTPDGIAEEGGALLVSLDAVESVNRGAFAFKPSGGFVLHLKEPQPRGWVPGLWWRFGNRFGVGGILPAWQAKLMADLIAEELRKRGETG